MSKTSREDEAPESVEFYAGFASNKNYNTEKLEAISGQKKAFWESRRAKELPPSYMKLGRSVKYSGKDIIAYLKSERREGRDGGHE